MQEKHPLNGLKLVNSTKLHLMQGPITLFDGDTYAGDAMIQDIAPGGERLVSYALDLETEVAVQKKLSDQEDQLEGMRKQSDQLRPQIQSLRKALEEYVLGLDPKA